jgi:ribosomal protein S18 acetylase RimI-like enzyme
VVETQHRSFLLEATTESFRPSARHRLKLERTTPIAWQRSKELWCGVGLGFWTARSRWTEGRWRQHLGEPAVSFWVAMRRGQDIGFFELVAQRRGIKIEGFGLLPSQRGRGFGSTLLSLATAEAFRLGGTRVWLHTATDDHPSALPNYLARGFRVYREQELKHPIPAKRETTRSAA